MEISNKPTSSTDAETAQAKEETTPDPTPLDTHRERSKSDDAQDIEESFFHASARAFIIMNVEPNKLNVGGREFRIKRNPVGEGCFVYDPRTRFHGVERLIVWWVRKEGEGYTLNSPSKMVTPGLKWPRDAPIKAPLTHEVVNYVFHGKPMSRPAPSSEPKLPPYTVREYKIYRAVISTPFSVSDEQANRNTAELFSVSVEEVEKVTKKVLWILNGNDWFGSPEGEIQRASDWEDEKPQLHKENLPKKENISGNNKANIEAIKIYFKERNQRFYRTLRSLKEM
ncbi:MAG: hypothetical protein JKY95_13300 [Planctomycetaceae bacterium]|nr:hypothetical protein [Planctomycetaceae bacterium]